MKKRGFTLIELSTVIVLLAMFAAAIAPHMGSVIEGSKRRAYRVSVLTLLKQGRTEAVSRGQKTEIKVESGTFQLTVPTDENDEVVGSVAAVQGVEASHNWMNGGEVSEGEWLLTFYPDGTSSGGGFQFDEGDSSQSVTVSKRNGQVSVKDEAANPTLDEEGEWDAGGIVQGGG